MWRRIDLMCLCLVSVRAMIWGVVWLFRMSWRYRRVVCMPLVLRVTAIMAGWE